MQDDRTNMDDLMQPLPGGGGAGEGTRATELPETRATEAQGTDSANSPEQSSEAAQTPNNGSTTPRWSFIFQYFVPSRLPGVVPALLFGGPRGPVSEMLLPPPPASGSGQSASTESSSNVTIPDALMSDLVSAAGIPLPESATQTPASASTAPQAQSQQQQPRPSHSTGARPPSLVITPQMTDLPSEDQPMNTAPPLSGPTPPGTAPLPPNAPAPTPTTPTVFLPNAINMAMSPGGFPIFFHPAVGPFVVTSSMSVNEGQGPEGVAPAAGAVPEPSSGQASATMTYHLTPLGNLAPQMIAQLFPQGITFVPFIFGNGGTGHPMGNWETDRGRPPTAPLEEIRKLPVMRYITKKLWDRNRSCTVCFEDLPCGQVPPPPASDSPIDKVIVKLPCSHLFHLPCLHPWLTQQSNACPTCRYELPTGDRQFDRGVAERMSLWKLEPQAEGADDEIVYEMLGEGDGTAKELGEQLPDDGCEMRRVVGRCLRDPPVEVSVPAELAVAEHIPISSEISGTRKIDDWNGSMMEMGGCGHQLHAECLASLLSVRGYAVPSSAEEIVRCPICRKPGSVKVVSVSTVEEEGAVPIETDEPTSSGKLVELLPESTLDDSRKRKADDGWVSRRIEDDGESLRTVIEDLD